VLINVVSVLLGSGELGNILDVLELGISFLLGIIKFHFNLLLQKLFLFLILSKFMASDFLNFGIMFLKFVGDFIETSDSLLLSKGELLFNLLEEVFRGCFLEGSSSL